MKIFVISGKQGSGKSTLARAIRDYYSQMVLDTQGLIHSLRFAGPLYEMHDAVRSVLKKYGFTNYDYNTKDGDLLQLIGTEWGRQKIDSNIWVSLLNNHLRTLPKNAIVTIEDCRFENEFDTFTTVPGVVTIRLECSASVRKLRADFWRENQAHPSEVSLDHYAAMNRFNFIFDTDKQTTEQIISILNLEGAFEQTTIYD